MLIRIYKFTLKYESFDYIHNIFKMLQINNMSGYIHMLVEVQPSISVSSFVAYLKGKSMYS